MEKYIPFSVRENVRDERLHPIIDYAERVLAWNIKFQYTDTDNWIIGADDYTGIIACFNGVCDIHMGRKLFHSREHQDILLEIYQALLPVIRDKNK